MKRNGRTCIEALNEVSLTIRAGQRVGVVGINGSGKSTLLRLLAGIYQPDGGRVSVQGRVSTLFSTTVGMSVHATAMDNIRDVATLMGMGRRDRERVVEDIIDFAEIGDFAHLPMRTYSTGMRARVGFGIATALEPSVLLVDEIMGTGDARFQAKARSRMENLIGDAGILILASHSAPIINTFCDTLIWLDRGSLVEVGPRDEVEPRFREALNKK
ncbi:ATP-binding cassette domain-containing protein [Maricaulis sp.]|uniref:ABC transporter ATP-binding protein n=1 Tax=Maricaulis sp. TaxID=1486257 RepID=UPI001B184F74|nr:ATP-binding cassette domain-containing protein [Maricaulis sp.]MBO6796526.1 ABC transporter ATP-binding protein [Maricaulis sp.]